MADRRFVVVSGLPASGKSMLARAVAPFLRLPVIDKDDILDKLFEAKGIGDMAWRRQLSRESDVLFRAEAVASAGALLTSFWHVPGMSLTSGTPTEWVLELSPFVVGLHCVCPAIVASERFLARQRHPGHLDGARHPDEVRSAFEALEAFGAPSLAVTLGVDTTRPVSGRVVATQLEEAFSRVADHIRATRL
jgi:glucokinase